MSHLTDFEHLKIQLKDIILATNDFTDEAIGVGGFGRVYKGELSLPPDGRKAIVAIKRLDRKFGQGDTEFWKEIMMLSQYKHENLISLLGFCNENSERILVYEYAAHGSLDHHLGKSNLTWAQFLRICHGAACGLSYLHDPNGKEQRVLHRDVKSSNILLDEDFTAKISDFGLSKIGPANQQYTYLISNIAGTQGYCDPVYMETGSLSKESDVYSFGVVLFEVICGRQCVEWVENELKIYVRHWKRCYEENRIHNIVSNNLKIELETDIDSLKTFTSIAHRCLHREHKERPTMAEIINELLMAIEYHELMSKDVNERAEYKELISIAKHNITPMHAIPTPITGKSKTELELILSKGIFVVDAGEHEKDENKVDMKPDMDLDTDWEKILSSDYAEIIKWSKYNLQWSSYKELYSLLHEGFLIKTDVEKWFSVSKNMKKRHMLPAKAVLQKGSIWNFLRGVKQWIWRSLPESRFKLVAECVKVKSFTIRSEIESQLLSLETTYACYLVYKLSRNDSMVDGLVQIDDENRVGDEQPSDKMQLVDLLTPTDIPVIRQVGESDDIPLRPRKIKGHPKLRKDGWLEIQIWDFRTGASHESISMNCRVKSYDNWDFTGLLVQGIEFRPAKVSFFART
ncbi:Phloem protein 2-like protein [Artemisia annua]|uniref:Phloem protein 2-like protein n=1 Tax=Artemisia annua TaxID=35608 RepID=A0A2U1L9Z7_ARTAN|nr:Phloem protein 2-like protein [Artemisia annua]